MATFTPRDLTLGPVAVMRILGIDPGTQVVGYGCLELAAVPSPGGSSSAEVVPLAMRGSNVVRAGEAHAGGVRLVTAGVLRLGGRSVSLAGRLMALADQFTALVRELSPSGVALEEAFFGKSVQAALRIGEARGVVLAESARSALIVSQYTPARVKRCVAGHGAARKQAVANMLAKMLVPDDAPLLKGLPADATDALAVAWTRLEELRSPLVGAAKAVRAMRSIVRHQRSGE